VPFAVGAHIDVRALGAGQAAVVGVAEQLDGGGGTSVLHSGLGPHNVGDVGSGQVDGNVRVCAGGGEGVVLVAGVVLIGGPAQSIRAGVRAHVGIHGSVGVEVPEDGGSVGIGGLVSALLRVEQEGDSVGVRIPAHDLVGGGAEGVDQRAGVVVVQIAQNLNFC